MKIIELFTHKRYGTKEELRAWRLNEMKNIGVSYSGHPRPPKQEGQRRKASGSVSRKLSSKMKARKRRRKKMARKTRKAAAVAAERGRLRFLKRRAQEISTPPTETPKLSSKEVEFWEDIYTNLALC